ncbi:hypothetical protein [Streptomyces niger]|uniref:hypothetical protein n=1 Tax=Streptomyces niger TaxID=66373 RepID=UPI000AF4B726|nr:hypothetical protein [Streptomyces niger]
MPGLWELAYTTAGGVVGAVVTTYVAGHHERRQLRATVQQQLLRLAGVRDGLADVVRRPGRAGRSARYPGGRRPRVSDELGLSVLLADGGDAERAAREAVEGLVVAALSAGVPRRVLDFAGGGEERALQCEVIRIVDHRLGGVLGDPLTELTEMCDGYRQATAQLLLQALWHPWRSRWRRAARIRALRERAAALHRRQVAAVAVLARPEFLDRL